MPKRLLCVLVAAMALAPTPAFAWGTAAHRYIMSRAIDLLPDAIKPFFEHFRTELVIRVVDPDTWRTAGWDDSQNHFVDFGVREYGAYPFDELPRDYDAAVEKFGVERLKQNGLLPWRFEEEFGNLRRAVAGFSSNASYAPSNTVLFAAVAAHYIQDAYQPLHATVNYDGRMTGQTGVHARFESALFERFETRLTVEPAAPAPMSSPRDTAFDALLASYRDVDAVLAADKAAAAGKDVYDDAYFERFFEAVKPILERRLAGAITATASLIVGAWDAAGRPALTVSVPSRVQRVR